MQATTSSRNGSFGPSSVGSRFSWMSGYPYRNLTEYDVEEDETPSQFAAHYAAPSSSFTLLESSSVGGKRKLASLLTNEDEDDVPLATTTTGYRPHDRDYRTSQQAKRLAADLNRFHLEEETFEDNPRVPTPVPAFSPLLTNPPLILDPYGSEHRFLDSSTDSSDLAVISFDPLDRHTHGLVPVPRSMKSYVEEDSDEENDKYDDEEEYIVLPKFTATDELLPLKVFQEAQMNPSGKEIVPYKPRPVFQALLVRASVGSCLFKPKQRSIVEENEDLEQMEDSSSSGIKIVEITDYDDATPMQ